MKNYKKSNSIHNFLARKFSSKSWSLSLNSKKREHYSKKALYHKEVAFRQLDKKRILSDSEKKFVYKLTVG